MTELTTIPIKTIDGKDDTLSAHAGKVLLVVNTASKCGLTPQYEGLEALYREFSDSGFEVLGFPANNFLAQEPGTEEEIAEFCKLTYDVSFPMYAKVSVAGEDRHPLYDELVAEAPEAYSPNGNGMRERLSSKDIPIWPEPEVLWNFEKFLIGKDGKVAARFAPDCPPTDEKLRAKIAELLAA